MVHRTFLVTGATKGIGLAVSERLAEAGHTIVGKAFTRCAAIEAAEQGVLRWNESFCGGGDLWARQENTCFSPMRFRRCSFPCPGRQTLRQ